MKPDTVGQQSESALELRSGTVPAHKPSAHSGVHVPRPECTPQKTTDDATRAYNPVEVAQLLNAADEATRKRCGATPENCDATPTKPPASADESTRAYSAADVASLLSTTPTDSPHQEVVAPLALEPYVETPPNTQRRGPPAPMSEVVAATAHDSKRSRPRALTLGLTLACVVSGAAWLVLDRAHSAPKSSWFASDTDALSKSVSANEEPRLVSLEIEIEPPGATLLLDGEPASNPLRLAYPRTDAVHEIRGEAPGYLSRSFSIKFDRNVLVVLALPKALPQAQGTLP